VLLKSLYPSHTALVTSSQSGSTQVINQDKLKFTPVTGETYLKITESPEIQLTESEVETERKNHDRKIWGNFYDLITIQGSIKIKNYKSQKVNLEVSRILIGKFKNSSIKIAKEKLLEVSNINPKNKIMWELELDAGEEKVIEYTYQILVRR